MSNFATRMMINAVGIPAILFLIHLGGLPFVIFIVIVSVIGQIEFYLLARRKGNKPIFLTAIISGVIWIIASFYLSEYLFYLLILIAIMFIIIGLFRHVSGSITDISSTILGFIYIPVFLSTIILLRKLYNEDDGKLVTLLFVSIWICDSLAFVFGKWLGKRKIAPKISPNKSIAGCIAGLFGSLMTVVIFYYLGWTPKLLSFTQLIVLGLIIGIFGQVGDFVESIFKRDAEVKDSSSFLLGHGGVLDRFDAFFIASPLVYLYIFLIL
ncbi:MAG: hypothetical protein DRP89_02185 [Candidatus Neomarinimicrobiota bacterium]|nr:MAG: hypothetical protein DRP89_02185 [Candidatus Neomarinimicrobiota bacterium]